MYIITLVEQELDELYEVDVWYHNELDMDLLKQLSIELKPDQKIIIELEE